MDELYAEWRRRVKDDVRGETAQVHSSRSIPSHGWCTGAEQCVVSAGGFGGAFGYSPRTQSTNDMTDFFISRAGPDAPWAEWAAWVVQERLVLGFRLTSRLGFDSRALGDGAAEELGLWCLSGDDKA